MIYFIVLLFLVLIQIVLISEFISLRKKFNKDYKYFENKLDIIDDFLYFITFCIVIFFVVYIAS